MTDQDQPLISLNSLASLADLSARMGRDLSIHRWRGNIWVEGWAPWAELDLIGREISVGPVRLRIEEPIGRCRATAANPETGPSMPTRWARWRALRPHRLRRLRPGADGGHRHPGRRGAHVKTTFTLAQDPSDEDREAGRLLFAGPVDFVKGVTAMAGLPPADRVEVCFAGRSNVGKSSLINALTGAGTSRGRRTRRGGPRRSTSSRWERAATWWTCPATAMPRRRWRR